MLSAVAIATTNATPISASLTSIVVTTNPLRFWPSPEITRPPQSAPTRNPANASSEAGTEKCGAPATADHRKKTWSWCAYAMQLANEPHGCPRFELRGVRAKFDSQAQRVAVI